MPIKSHVIPPAVRKLPSPVITWGLAISTTGEPVVPALGTSDLGPPLLPLTEDLLPIYVSVLCKTWPTSGNLVFDILFRPFGSATRQTISDGAAFIVPNSGDTVVLTNVAEVILAEFGELTLDVISGGGAANITVRLKCKQYNKLAQQGVIPISILPAGPGFGNYGSLEFLTPQSSFAIALVG